MNEVDLKKRAEELELMLNLQLQQLKKDSQVWVIGGGVALVTGLITYGVIKRKKKLKRKKRAKAEAAAYQQPTIHPNLESRRKKRTSRSSSFFPTLKRRLLFSLLSYGQSKLVAELNRRRKN
jgi:hypothetical protein